jgi:amidase
MITLSAGVATGGTEMSHGLALMGTAWSEPSLVKWASAIEDLQLSSGTKWKRTLPGWGELFGEEFAGAELMRCDIMDE